MIFNAWSDEPWNVEGAAVRVALICFTTVENNLEDRILNGHITPIINANLTAGTDVTTANIMKENRGQSMLGVQKSGPFDVSGSVARVWLCAPTNPNGRPNSEVLKPYWNGEDITGRPRDCWLIDLPRDMNERDVALYEFPFRYFLTAAYNPPDDPRTLREVRGEARDDRARKKWWEPYWPRPEMRRRIEVLKRYLVTAETSEHRIFVWLGHPIIPDKNLIVISRADDEMFGIMNGRIHEIWSTQHGNRMGKGNQRRYNNSVTFETFPFPEGLTPNLPAASYADDPRAQRIAAAAKMLNERREAWLNPPDLVVRTPEVVPGYPDRLLPVDEAAAKELRKRTLTNLYNQRPAWLDHLHRELDAAVAAAYGWPDGMEDEEILRRLFLLNQERAAAGR